MPINRKLLWFIPIVFVVLGFLLAPKLWGLTKTWEKIGKPADKIEKIIGVIGSSLVVQTDKGETYSLDLEQEFFHHNSSWVKTVNETWPNKPVPTQAEDVFSWPPPFRVKEIIKTKSLVGAECAPDLSVGLSWEGEVWIWVNDTNCGLIPVEKYMAYCLVPIVGFLLGGLLVGLGLGLSKILAKRKQSSAL